jgi:hypothetical protein
MSHRIDVELTSKREDGSWTWRAAGARQPKGVVDGALIPEGVSVGDVVRAEAEMGVDGTSIVSVKPPKGRQRDSVERIEIVGSGVEQPAVTTQLAKGRRLDDGDRDRRRGDRSGGDRGRGRGDTGRDGQRQRRGDDRRPGRGDRDDRRGSGSREAGSQRSGRQRPPRESTGPSRPRPARLRPGQAHRHAFLAQLPDEQQPLARLVVRGGVPLVRDTLATQRKAAEQQGIPAVNADPVVDVAEKLAPHARLAEWMDRADAALAQANEVDLRDLRSVVVAADGVARHEQTRELAEQLRQALTQRVDHEQRVWLDELGTLVGEGRAIAALRLSSRPPKAGSPLPPPLASSLTDLVTAQLTADTAQDRYAAVVDALAYAPVRAQVIPEGVPAEPTETLLGAIRKLADRVPQVATAFGLQTEAASSGVRPPVPPPPAPRPPAPTSDAPAPAAEVAPQESEAQSPDA